MKVQFRNVSQSSLTQSGKIGFTKKVDNLSEVVEFVEKIQDRTDSYKLAKHTGNKTKKEKAILDKHIEELEKKGNLIVEMFNNLLSIF